MDNNERTSENKRDVELENILALLNNILSDDEIELTKKFEKPRYPALFIVGNARSGTTLLYQWLAATGLFAYPSNIISRFYKAPYIGALIHKIFVEHDKFGELLGNQALGFQSHLGKTKSPVSPHEFWYFWRRFFAFGESQKLSKEELSSVDGKSFMRELAALENAFDKPVSLKGMILNWNLSYLNDLIPQSIFIHLKRTELYNIHSLYKARKNYFGDINKWYSFKPPEYSFLKDRSVYEQLAGQVFYTNKAIEKELEVCPNNVIEIHYRDFCADPKNLFDRISKVFKELGYSFSEVYNGPEMFENRNKITDITFDMDQAKKALTELHTQIQNK